MNEVSIIVNGVRYDSVLLHEDNSCDYCDLYDYCKKVELYRDICTNMIGYNSHFTKSKKTFEK